MAAIDTANEAVAKPYDQFILFGDSITQMSYNQEIGFGYGAQLQEGVWLVEQEIYRELC